METSKQRYSVGDSVIEGNEAQLMMVLISLICSVIYLSCSFIQRPTYTSVHIILLNVYRHKI